MSAHEDLTAIIDNGANYERDPDTSGWKIVPEWAANAVIAAGYVKMPSREALAEALFQVYDHGTSPNAFREADAILALLAGKTS